jgi:hypothetical protein
MKEKVQLHLQEAETKKQHKLAIQQEQQEAAAEAQARAAQVRKELAAGDRRRARSEGARLEAGRAHFQEKLAREEEARQQNLEHIGRMEREEQDLIQRLQRTQERHRVAYAQLEDAIAGGGSGGASASSSRRPGSAREMLENSQVATTASASRPPRPRIASVPTPTGATRSVTSVPTPTGATRSSVPSLRRARSQSPQVSRPCSGSGKNSLGVRDNSSHSICSTVSGGPRPESVASGQISGQSTPCSQSKAAITYTTVDGLQIDIPPEDDLDLDKLLSG